VYQILDILIVGAAASAVWIACLGGGVVHLGGVRLSATTVLPPLEIALVLAAVRARFGPIAFLSIHALDIQDAARLAQNWWRRRHADLSRLRPRGAAACVLAAAACSLAIKLYNARVHFGFWTGDDVEIQEMTIGSLYRMGWPVWDLRCAFYPMVFIYPAQAFLKWAVAADVRTLVFGSRVVVALWSTLDVWLTYRVAARVFRSMPVGVLAGIILAFSKLQVMAGSTELPRVVSTAFVLLACGWLQREPVRGSGALLAGAALGTAAAMRFSEEVFLLAAMVQLLGQTRWRDAIVMTAAFGVTVLVAVGVSDWLYWGHPFSSLRHIVGYTIVQGQSSRGFQPFYEYAVHLGAWTNLVIVALAILGIRSGARAIAWWTWLPVIVLSILPHKEPRYLIPVLPFVSMSAAEGLWRLIEAVGAAGRTRDAEGRVARWSAALMVALAAAFAWEAAGFRFIRSESAIRLAEYIRQQPGVERVLVEQLWRMGGRLYFPPRMAPLDLDPSLAGDAAYVAALLAAGRVQLAAIDAADTRPAHALSAAGFHEVIDVPEAAAARYRLFGAGATGTAVESTSRR
jgi:hypothetical protein